MWTTLLQIIRNTYAHTFKVGGPLENPFILFANTNCSETLCPANGRCDKDWRAHVDEIQLDIDDMAFDPSITLRCTGWTK